MHADAPQTVLPVVLSWTRQVSTSQSALTGAAYHAHSLISLRHMHGVLVSFAVDGDCAYAQPPGCADDPAGYLPPVGYQQLVHPGAFGVQYAGDVSSAAPLRC